MLVIDPLEGNMMELTEDEEIGSALFRWRISLCIWRRDFGRD